MPVVVGRIEPHVFRPGEASRMLEAVAPQPSADVPVAELTRATQMANAAQVLWDALRDSDAKELDRIAAVAPELSSALAGVRAVMIGL